ncbi:hypothetical protein HDV03_004892 [Kappamyces sp. JEL0829]|nr:hypothetical protein HDV03_004892 [Kappamyces sp. JEL0829]
MKGIPYSTPTDAIVSYILNGSGLVVSCTNLYWLRTRKDVGLPRMAIAAQILNAVMQVYSLIAITLGSFYPDGVVGGLAIMCLYALPPVILELCVLINLGILESFSVLDHRITDKKLRAVRVVSMVLFVILNAPLFVATVELLITPESKDTTMVKVGILTNITWSILVASFDCWQCFHLSKMIYHWRRETKRGNQDKLSAKYHRTVWFYVMACCIDWICIAILAVNNLVIGPSVAFNGFNVGMASGAGAHLTLLLISYHRQKELALSGIRPQVPLYQRPAHKVTAGTTPSVQEPTPHGSPTSQRQIQTATEFGRDFNNKILLTHLQTAFPATEVVLCEIGLVDYRQRILEWLDRANGRSLCFLNLCDGIETDGYPGLSVVQFLESRQIAFTGSGADFYINSTSKTRLKNLMLEAKVATLPFVVVQPATIDQDLQQAAEVVGYPLIIKPSVSYGSMMISTASIVDNADQAKAYLSTLGSYQDEIFLESFLAGREFTVLCTGDHASGVRVFTPAERVFSETLGEREKILSFDICWDGCDLDKNDSGEVPEQPYSYAPAPLELQPYLQGETFALTLDLARRAYIAVSGTGYGRVDIRTRTPASKDAFVLELNANCGLAFGRMASSLGEILILSQVSPDEFLKEIVEYGLGRFRGTGSSL